MVDDCSVRLVDAGTPGAVAVELDGRTRHVVLVRSPSSSTAAPVVAYDPRVTDLVDGADGVLRTIGALVVAAVAVELAILGLRLAARNHLGA